MKKHLFFYAALILLALSFFIDPLKHMCERLLTDAMALICIGFHEILRQIEILMKNENRN